MKEIFGHTEFYTPWALLLLVLIPILAIWLYKNRYNERAKFLYSDLAGFGGFKTIKNKMIPVLAGLLLLSVGLVSIGIARPRSVDVTAKTKKTKGIDIMLAVDVSASMLARDLKPNRLEALKKTAIDFIKKRPNDRFGVVLYAGEAFTQVPITSDQRIVMQAIRKINFNQLFNQLEQGTAIGMGLATAVNRLKDSKAKSKVIILMTDGVNNTGEIDPYTALELAKEFGIKVYTIGLGTNGYAPTPVGIRPDGSFQYQNAKVEIDENLLKKIAKETGGKYFRATDNKKLDKIYKEIDKLEKTEIKETKYYNYKELYRPFVLIAVILIFLVGLLRYTWMKSFV
jgi:Ca-activated chloride channel family protein